MLKKGSLVAVVLTMLMTALAALSALAATVSPRSSRVNAKSKSSVTENARAKKRMTSLSHRRGVVRRVRRTRRHRYYERFTTSSFATGAADGDLTGGEDPVVRQAAVEALGNMNGTVLALDPMTGRILAMVNQPLALSEGGQPCSTVKLAVALAGLSENLITRDTRIALTRRWKMDLTGALAHSNNAYFEALGRRLGFEKVSYYAHQFGLGEMAGYNIEGEHLGIFPSEEIDARLGGVGKMCSFGEGISLTPLQLGALVGAIANGGTLYYLQHPTSPEEVATFQPKVKRYLDIGNLVPEMSPGLAGAVDYGTARSLRWSFNEEQILGKTGTCSKDGTRLGWFASFANTQYGRLVVVVFLRGGRPTFGGKAAEIAGHVYRNLYEHSFFATRTPLTPVRSNSTAVGVSQ